MFTHLWACGFVLDSFLFFEGFVNINLLFLSHLWISDARFWIFDVRNLWWQTTKLPQTPPADCYYPHFARPSADQYRCPIRAGACDHVILKLINHFRPVQVAMSQQSQWYRQPICALILFISSIYVKISSKYFSQYLTINMFILTSKIRVMFWKWAF